MAGRQGRVVLPDALSLILEPSVAHGVGASLASMTTYLVMALVLVIKPRGLFPTHG